MRLACWRNSKEAQVARADRVGISQRGLGHELGRGQTREELVGFLPWRFKLVGSQGRVMSSLVM